MFSSGRLKTWKVVQVPCRKFRLPLPALSLPSGGKKVGCQQNCDDHENDIGNEILGFHESILIPKEMMTREWDASLHFLANS
ncbi:hypothetical protein [Noviherbaspirillum sp.]|uniref:hypothetical protein n=1 Tax=Noviherbaspirillum sp. TaxID=1926288 RepID=UPI002FE36C20